ncbi:TPA: amino acid permease [Pseudomonas aeruginosa]|uniref:Amino acid permease n=1 Tax=Pseudomonas aeruginosa TaxID=287 RepID=A0ABD7JZT7_PSEAI|nr:amino acid permease [Pseudomonas paraeruginosa]KAB0741759.1 amino acid permease [Pseudomonas aeruginosa]MCO3057995.1 amino acid permease [Pseudomonas aeruginosa]MCO3132465.1 amino acid permease [Pseudomonas aeruginosa]MCO3160097.1 amino acid permease [Pseudomonas aeruginosa]
MGALRPANLARTAKPDRRALSGPGGSVPHTFFVAQKALPAHRRDSLA